MAELTDELRESRTITVCDECLRACCWKGIFMCDVSRNAGTTEKTVEELRGLGREHSDYWDGSHEKQQEARRVKEHGAKP